ncbi:MAG: hypothetical protein PHT95_06605, partial [Candidatus Omnitrophica bacterium]|nr:hypothetical protein [Candidatus Omnitrophota bacterium]
YKVTRDISGEISVTLRAATLDGVTPDIYPLMIAKKVADEEVLLGDKEYLIKRGDGGLYTVSRGEWAEETTESVTIDGRAYFIEDSGERMKLVLQAPAVDGTYSYIQVVKLQDGTLAYVSFDGSEHAVTGGTDPGTYSMLPVGGYGERIALVRDSQVSEVSASSYSNGAVVKDTFLFAFDSKPSGKADVYFGGQILAEDIEAGDVVSFNGTLYVVSEDAAGRLTMAWKDVTSAPLEGQAILIGNTIYSVTRSDLTGDFSVTDGTDAFRSHRFKVLPVDGEPDDSTDGDPTYSGMAATNLVNVGGRTYLIDKYQGSATYVLKEMHLAGEEIYASGDIRTEEVEYSVRYDFHKGVYVFTNKLTGQSFESDDLRRSVRLENDVLYTIYTHPVTKAVTVTRAHTSQTVVNSAIEVDGKKYMVRKRGTDTRNFVYMPDGVTEDETSIARSYLMFGEHLVDIGGRTYVVENSVDELGNEIVRLSEKEIFVTSAMIDDAATVRIDKTDYAVTRISEGEPGIYKVTYTYPDGITVKDYYSDPSGLLRIGKDAFQISEIQEYSISKVKLAKMFASIPVEAPVYLGGKIYNVEYDYMTGRYIFDDGYDAVQSSDDRTSVTLEGVLYDITRDAETNVVKLSERSPVSVEFVSTYGRRSVVLADGELYSIGILPGGIIRISTPQAVYVSDAKGNIQAGKDRYSVSVQTNGELLFSRSTESRHVEGTLLKTGNAYVVVGKADGAVVDQSDTTALEALYEEFSALDVNADGVLDEADINAMKRQLEGMIEEYDALRKKALLVDSTIRSIYSESLFTPDELGAADFDGSGYIEAVDRAAFAEALVLYNSLDLNALERNEIVVHEGTISASVYGKPYTVTYDELGQTFTLVNGDESFSVTVEDGDSVVFPDAQVSYLAQVADMVVEGTTVKALTLTRDTQFSCPAKPAAGGAEVPITIHGKVYQVSSISLGTINGENRYRYTLTDTETSYSSVMKGLLDKVWIEGYTFDINDSGAGLILEEENITETGVYLTAESARSTLIRLLIEVIADVAGPAGSAQPDGVLDDEDVKRLRIYPMDVNGDGRSDNLDIDLVWSVIDASRRVVSNYDINPNGKIDAADISAFEYL